MATSSGQTTLIDTLNNYMDRVVMVAGELKLSQVAILVHRLRKAKADGNSVFVIGNGGSQANAQHLTLHLRDRGIRAIDLMADGSWLTAQSNDRGYSESAANLLALLQKADDLIIVLSGSGNSPNIVECLKRATGYKVGLLGFDGGKAFELCDLVVHCPSVEYGVVEDCHSIIIHMLYESLTEALR